MKCLNAAPWRASYRVSSHSDDMSSVEVHVVLPSQRSQRGINPEARIIDDSN